MSKVIREFEVSLGLKVNEEQHARVLDALKEIEVAANRTSYAIDQLFKIASPSLITVHHKVED